MRKKETRKRISFLVLFFYKYLWLILSLNHEIDYIILIEDSSNEAEISSVLIPYHFIHYTADKKIYCI